MADIGIYLHLDWNAKFLYTYIRIAIDVCKRASYAYAHNVSPRVRTAVRVWTRHEWFCQKTSSGHYPPAFGCC